MRKKLHILLLRHLALLCLLVPVLTLRVCGQQTVGLFQADPSTTEGYVLFGPLASTNTYLIDNCGRQVHTWQSGYTPGAATKLLDNGQLLRTCKVSNPVFGAVGGVGGRVELLDWNSSVQWHYTVSDNSKAQHHDAIMLPNGNVMVVAWEAVDSLDAIAAGRNPATMGAQLWPDMLLEIEPTTPGNGNVVWEWHAWDHIVQDFDSNKPNYGVVSDHPELLNLNYVDPTSKVNWFHVNGIAYNADRDEIAISSHRWDEIWIIDHSTTTQEAAGHTGGNSGHGGDLLYRYGNPQTYGRGTVNDQKFFGQHNIEWVAAGDPYAGMLKVFNNGLARPDGPYSTLEIFDPPMDNGRYVLNPGQAYGPSAPAWMYKDTVNFYSMIVSNFERLPNGHQFICEGALGHFFEIDSLNNVLWSYVNPVTATGPVNQGDSIPSNIVFRANRIVPTHPGLAGQTLTPGNPIEGNPLPIPSGCNGVSVAEPSGIALEVYPNPVGQMLTIRRSSPAPAELRVMDSYGRVVLQNRVNGAEVTADLGGLAPGIYFLRIGAGAAVKVAKL